MIEGSLTLAMPLFSVSELILYIFLLIPQGCLNLIEMFSGK